VEHLRGKFGISKRRVCRVVGQPRSSQRYAGLIRGDEEVLRAEIVRLASRYGRYEYRRITALLRNDGWGVNRRRVENLATRGVEGSQEAT
jgi:putative transposase